MLRVEGAVVRFEGRAAVDDVDLDVPAHETVAVLGPSGCGKTTLLRAIAGLQPLDAGRVTWGGADLREIPPHRRRFGLVFQEYALFPHRDVDGNVAFGLRMAGVEGSEQERRVHEVLDLVGLAHLRGRRVASLSGGEQQRVALARALAVEPRLLMLDEPLGALDRVWRTRLLVELRRLLDVTGVAAVYVTHDHEEAFSVASTIVVMRAGRVVQRGAPSDVWTRPVDAWTAEFLGFGPAIAARVVDGRLELPWGAPHACVAGTTGRVTAVLRPDAVALAGRGATPAGPSIDAVVMTTVFAGADVAVAVQPAAGPSVTLRVPTREALRVGERVRITIDPGAVLVYPAD